MMPTNSASRMYNEKRSLNKRQLTKIIIRRFTADGIKITGPHVTSIINILFDIMNADIAKDKYLKIGNLVELKLSRMPAKKGMNYYTGQLGMTKPYNKLWAIINKNLSAFLLKYIDVDAYLDKDNKDA